MEIFMDKNNVLGMWLAYFENSRLCDVEICRDGLEQIHMASKNVPSYMKVAHIDW